MKEFECIGPDGRTYLHNDNWLKWRHERFLQYPCPQGKFRFDITISKEMSSDRLETVPTFRNPHAFHGTTLLRPTDCYYECNDWSTIYGIHENGHNELRMLIESGNPDPVWGEKITFYSTSSWINQEPWGRNSPNMFVKLGNRFYLVTHSEFLHNWYETRHVEYPLTNPRNTGYFFARYIPILRTPVVFNPVNEIVLDFTPALTPALPTPPPDEEEGESYLDKNVLINTRDLILYREPPRKRTISVMASDMDARSLTYFLQMPQIDFLLYTKNTIPTLCCYFKLPEDNELYLPPLPNISGGYVCLGHRLSHFKHLSSKNRAKYMKGLVSEFWNTSFTISHGGDIFTHYFMTTLESALYFLKDWEADGLTIPLIKYENYNRLKQLGYNIP